VRTCRKDEMKVKRKENEIGSGGTSDDKYNAGIRSENG
jgi:hypothetical protein